VRSRDDGTKTSNPPGSLPISMSVLNFLPVSKRTVTLYAL
jgi:hypothetical protein